MSTTWLDPNLAAAVTVGAGVISVGLLVVVVSQSLQLRKMRQQWTALMQDSRGESLEDLLERHFQERAALRLEVNDHHLRVDALEKKMKTAKRHLGIVKYDAFDEVSGGQSFSVSLYDDDGNGVVLSSVVGRSLARLYAKGLISGEAVTPLSDEEHAAMREGWSSGKKGGVS
ncbi:MAG: DUF4446 family protein [Fimbriimonadaceae bacterium]|nr:DUF4446 family protein [Fimbriimonadaceae bacterium]